MRFSIRKIDQINTLISKHSANINIKKYKKDCTYIGNTKERHEEGGNHNEKSKKLSVFVEEFKLINQSCDHRFHPTHLQQNTEELG